jgi:Glycogen debranching enzyme N terminal
MIECDQQMCQNPDAACTREWLETNGIGGFASSTIAGLHTRRYHGLLTAATKPPVGRVLLLSELEETLVLNGQRFELSANQYPGVVHPQGYRHLKRFRLWGRSPRSSTAMRRTAHAAASPKPGAWLNCCGPRWRMCWDRPPHPADDTSSLRSTSKR